MCTSIPAGNGRVLAVIVVPPATPPQCEAICGRVGAQNNQLGQESFSPVLQVTRVAFEPWCTNMYTPMTLPQEDMTTRLHSPNHNNQDNKNNNNEKALTPMFHVEAGLRGPDGQVW